MTVELLYFDGCPSYQRLLPSLRELIAELAPGAELELRRIESIEDAERAQFLGSPTVRVEGVDVDAGAAERGDFGLKCRLYRSDGVTSPLPPEEWIREALARSER
ncbi:MAG: DF family (seleno)protein [Solirubrobacterales bacterium]